mgnify:CR=1 FL=1
MSKKDRAAAYNADYAANKLRADIDKVDWFRRLVIKWHRWRARLALAEFRMARGTKNEDAKLKKWRAKADHHIRQVKLIVKENKQ